MAENPVSRRRSIRLKAYDYSRPGAYFVTLCTHDREYLFGKVANDTMLLNSYGQITEDEWLRTPQVRTEVELDVFVVMPNHLHGIVWMKETGADSARRAHGHAPLRRQPRSLGALVAGFKSGVTKRVNALRCTPNARVWQRNYYERVVRNEEELERVREYIINNPIRWALDGNNPANLKRKTTHGKGARRAPSATPSRS